MESDHPHRAIAEKLAADLIDAPYVLRRTAVDAILAAFDDVTGTIREQVLADVREVLGKDAWKDMMRHYDAGSLAGEQP